MANNVYIRKTRGTKKEVKLSDALYELQTLSSKNFNIKEATKLLEGGWAYGINGVTFYKKGSRHG